MLRLIHARQTPTTSARTLRRVVITGLDYNQGLQSARMVATPFPASTAQTVQASVMALASVRFRASAFLVIWTTSRPCRAPVQTTLCRSTPTRSPPATIPTSTASTACRTAQPAQRHTPAARKDRSSRTLSVVVPRA